MSANYPDGVTDAHPHFNPSETYTEVECTTEEALVIPSFEIKADLVQLKEFADGFSIVAQDARDGDRFTTLGMMIGQLQRKIDEIEREGDYECQWKGEQELPVSEEAEWDCPRCGVTQTTDTVPEDRDPDEGWDNRHDD
jgi:hypothetical protein